MAGCSNEAGSLFFGRVAHSARYTFTAEHTVHVLDEVHSEHSFTITGAVAQFVASAKAAFAE